MRKHIVAGNWKMNCTKQDAEALAADLKAMNSGKTDVKVFVSALHIPTVQNILGGSIDVGAQNMYAKDSGAYTGEISPTQIKSYDLEWVLLGHSERRSIFGESDALLKDKVDSAMANGLNVMFCIGETLAEREAGNAEAVVKQQMTDALFHLTDEQWRNVVIAYEPVWAIGTGLAATPEQAQDMHAFIRSLVTEKYGESAADDTSILYGGSVKPNNAQEIFAKPDIDGGLIGGASLKADSFEAIVTAR